MVIVSIGGESAAQQRIVRGDPVVWCDRCVAGVALEFGAREQFGHFWIIARREQDQPVQGAANEAALGSERIGLTGPTADPDSRRRVGSGEAEAGLLARQG